MSNLAVISKLVDGAKGKFEKIYHDDGLTFEREKNFVVQIFANNDYLQKIALQNQMKTAGAICNVAAMGVTLNPAAKEAYLVPRGNVVCLDISYMGLLKAAVQDGACIAAKCNIVYSHDDFVITGQFSEPQHSYNPFSKNRGEIVGVYATLKINENTYYTETMSSEELDKIRMLNEAEKKGRHSPWQSFPEEMMKKTVLKRALKFVKGKSSRTDQIIDHMNQSGEGIKTINKRYTYIEENPEEALLEIISNDDQSEE